MSNDNGGERPSLITGGCGFIGSNVAAHLLDSGRQVILLDNLSRAGVERNRKWLMDRYGDRVEFVQGDVRDGDLVRQLVARAGQVFHFAAQVAVTTSLTDPITDFDVNARGTLNVLEALRALDEPPPLLFTSTNKVYGGLEDLEFAVENGRYVPLDADIRARGIGEDRPLDFHSPYGCSKGSADQYVIDYARTFGIKAVVFRMSCIYGYRQFGNEDQGWVAHFLIQALKDEAVTLYGDGKQVRDILFIDDLVRAMMLAMGNIDRLSAHAFNMGGGPSNVISLLDLLDSIHALNGRKLATSFEAWRPGDQRYYVADTTKFQEATGWKPQISSREGIQKLFCWLEDQGYGPLSTAVEERILQVSGR